VVELSCTPEHTWTGEYLYEISLPLSLAPRSSRQLFHICCGKCVLQTKFCVFLWCLLVPLFWNLRYVSCFLVLSVSLITLFSKRYRAIHPTIYDNVTVSSESEMPAVSRLSLTKKCCSVAGANEDFVRISKCM
jgi:hypothetical protein